MRYTVNYAGTFFVEDNEGFNSHSFCNFKKARDFLWTIIMFNVDKNAYLKDEEYQCSMYWDSEKQEFYWEG